MTHVSEHEGRPGGPEAAQAFDGAGDSLPGVRPIAWIHAVTGLPATDDKKLGTAVAFALLRVAPLRRHPLRGWVFFASNPDLCAWSGLGESSVTKGLRALRDAGALALVRRGGGTTNRGRKRANEWQLVMPDSSVRGTADSSVSRG